MRNKKAKEIKRISKTESEGIPWRRYRKVMYHVKDSNEVRETFVLHDCGRRDYQKSKAEYKSR